MASRKVHCADCTRKLGEAFDKVHAWLDGLVPKYGIPRHRIFRHNMLGIEEVRRIWGDKAAEAARIHIVRDFGLPNIPGEPYRDIPKDEKHASILLAVWLHEMGMIKSNPLYEGKEVEE